MWTGSLKLQNKSTKEVIFVTKQSDGDRITFDPVNSDYDLLDISITYNGIAHPVHCSVKFLPKDSYMAITNLPKPEEPVPTKSVSDMTALDRVVVWNARRNLNTFKPSTSMTLLHREYEELLRHLLEGQPTIDDWCDLIVVAAGAIYQQGYNPELAMMETVKEINSRQGTIDPTTGKWEKQKDQPLETLYTADYNLAKY